MQEGNREQGTGNKLFGYLVPSWVGSQSWKFLLGHVSGLLLAAIAWGLSGCDTLLNASKDIVSAPQTPATAPPQLRSASKPSTSSHLSPLETSIYEQVNQYRKSRNLSPLTLDARISEQARLHSQAMANGKVPFSHNGFEQRVKAIAKSISYRSAAENVAYNEGYTDPARQAVEGWLNSPGHLTNIEGDFNLTGVGVVKNAQGQYYFTQIFIRRA